MLKTAKNFNKFSTENDYTSKIILMDSLHKGSPSYTH